MKTLPSIASLLFPFLLVSCRPPESGEAWVNPDAEPVEHRFEVRGIVTEVRSDGKTLMIHHEAIPDYMEEMIMPFRLKNPADVDGLEAGQAVQFELVVTATRGWIERLRPIPRAEVRVTETGDYVIDGRPPRPDSGITPLRPGDPVADVILTNDLGTPIALSDFRGAALGLTFIYTRCPYPEFCPRMSTNFARVSQILSAADLPANWHLLTISFDPDFDTPRVLHQYAAQYRRNPERWTFATGSAEAIGSLAGQFDLKFVPMTIGSGWDHNVRAAVIDVEGRVRRLFTDNEWAPEEFAAAMMESVTAPRAVLGDD